MLIDRTLVGFQPRSSVISAFTFVRRRPIGLGTDIVGLFDEHKPQVDYCFTVLALVAEGLILWLSLDRMPLEYRVALLISAIIIDVMLAFGHHRFSANGALMLRRDLASYDAKKFKRDDLTAKYSRALANSNNLARVFAGLLVITAVIKIFILWIAFRQQFNTIFLAATVSYIVICLIHIFKTGFAIAHLNAAGILSLWGFSRDRKTFINNPQDKDLKANILSEEVLGGKCVADLIIERQLKIPGATTLDPEHIYPGPRGHHLKVSSDGKSIFLHASGVLYTDDIRELMNVVKIQPDARREIALAGLNIQLHGNYTNEK
jgi:hypothetical protein